MTKRAAERMERERRVVERVEEEAEKLRVSQKVRGSARQLSELQARTSGIQTKNDQNYCYPKMTALVQFLFLVLKEKTTDTLSEF